MHFNATSVECKDDYILSIVFDNGERGLLDMNLMLDFGVFKKLREPRMFATAHIAFGAITWDSGADLDPEFVYAKCALKK
ncbi:MAG: DUF2442 domain-containing protein [Gammaproteobacteria bacterium]